MSISSETQKVYTPESVGLNQGLVVILNATADDYFYSTRSFIGFSIHVFSNYDFPDVFTGTVHEQVVDANEEVFMRLHVSTLLGDDSIRAYSTEQRGCLFDDEMYEQFNGHYSLSQCLLKCKIRSIIALCKCIPFQFPSHFATESATEHIQTCTLNNIECLNRYRGERYVQFFN